MKRPIRILSSTLALAAVAAGALAISAPIEAAPTDSGRKQVQLACKPGWRGSVAGQYGGVSFGLACDNGRSTAILDGTVGTSWSARIGVESETGAFDCFFSGDSPVVQERCVDVRISIK